MVTMVSLILKCSSYYLRDFDPSTNNQSTQKYIIPDFKTIEKAHIRLSTF
jgi:hypothetical protein